MTTLERGADGRIKYRVALICHDGAIWRHVLDLPVRTVNLPTTLYQCVERITDDSFPVPIRQFTYRVFKRTREVVDGRRIFKEEIQS